MSLISVYGRIAPFRTRSRLNISSDKKFYFEFSNYFYQSSRINADRNRAKAERKCQRQAEFTMNWVWDLNYTSYILRLKIKYTKWFFGANSAKKAYAELENYLILDLFPSTILHLGGSYYEVTHKTIPNLPKSHQVSNIDRERKSRMSEYSRNFYSPPQQKPSQIRGNNECEVAKNTKPLKRWFIFRSTVPSYCTVLWYIWIINCSDININSHKSATVSKKWEKFQEIPECPNNSDQQWSFDGCQ